MPAKVGMYEAILRRTQQNLVTSTDRVHVYRHAKKAWSRSLARKYAQVPIEELIQSDEFMGLSREVWPAHQEDIINLWERRRNEGTWKAYFNEGIGSGKTYKAGMALWLLVYENIIREDPLGFYGLGKGGGIGLICMSRNYTLSKDVTFKKIAPFFNCPFFNTYFPCQIDWSQLDEMRRLPDALYFPKRIAIWAGGGSAMGALGYDLFGGVIDEIAFLENVEDSARAMRPGEHYDAAEETVNAITKRMASRFLSAGKLPGLLMMISSSRYEGDYLNRMIKRHKSNPKVMCRVRALWDAKPSVLPNGQVIWGGENCEIDLDTLEIFDSKGNLIAQDYDEVFDFSEQLAEL